MSPQTHPDFSNPWCLALSADPTLQPIPTASRTPYPQTGENSLLATSLANPSCIRAVQTYLKYPPHTPSPTHPPSEVYMLFSLGSNGLNGIAGTCHGAIIALMLDEVMGQLAAEMFGRYNIVTAKLDVEFRRRLETPRVVVARAFVEERGGARGNGGTPGEGEKRKVEIRGRVEDGEGGVFACGRSVFVRLRSRL